MSPSPATVQQQNGSAKTQAPALLIPFTRAAKEHEEPFVDQTYTVNGASSVQQAGPFDVPAYGYMRHIKLLVQATGGTGTAAVYQPDAPFIAFQEVALIDVNGAPIVGPFSGYDLYLVNKYGGYKKLADPKQKPSYTAPATSGNYSFSLRIPVEIANRDALGSLANQNASSTYKLRYSVNTAAAIYSTNPTGFPSLRIRAWLEAWTQPAPQDLRGHTQATAPPAHGTTQYWSKTQITLNSGTQTQRLPRVGNYIRMIVFIYRDASGVRSTVAAQWPDPLQISWDTRLLNNFGLVNWQDLMAERYDLRNTVETAGGLDNSVYVNDYAHEFDGRVGEELRDGWLPTVQSTRLEVYGNFGTSGSLTALTCDVSPAGEVFV